MSFFKPERRSISGTYNPFENPSVPLASVALDSYGRVNNDAGANVTVDAAAALPIVYRCISLLSTVIAGCPVEQYRKKDQEQIPNSLFDSGNQNMTYTQFELWELVVSHLCGWGDAFVYKKRDAGPDGPGSGVITDLRPVYPGCVKVTLDDFGNQIFLVQRLNRDGTIDKSSKPNTFTTFEIMHIPGLGFNGLTGMSPITMAAQTIGTTIAADKLAARFYSSGSQLGGIIKVKAPLTSQTQAEGIKNRWMQNNAGVAHAGNVAVLDAETDFQSITIEPEALQFLESRRWQTTEIARLFGIPPHLVGDVEKSTSWGTGIEQQNIGFIAYTIAGWTNRIEQRLTREVVSTRGQYAEFNLDRLLRGSMQERYLAYAQAINAGWISADEIRVKEMMHPLGGKWSKPFPPAGLTQPTDGTPPGANEPQPDDSGDE
jgi:HK97 family phage portal protein